MRAAGRVFKGLESGGRRIARANRARWLRSGRVRLGLKVEDESDRWTPPGRDTGARGRPVSGCGEGGARTRAVLALGPKPGTGPRREERGKGAGRPRGRGEREKWAEPETGRGRGNPFPFAKFIFSSNLLKRIFKTI